MFWSVIAANRRKTVLLIVLMGLSLVSTGAMIGMALADAYHPHAALIGAAAAGVVWAVLLLAALFGSDEVLLGLSRAREVTRDVYPQLLNVVEEMVIAGSLPCMPRVFVVDDPSPNAFAVGKSPEKSCICVTAGLLALCGRDELQGVVAHEIGHIMNRDVLYMTVAATMLGSILLLSDVFLRSFRFTSTARLSSRPRRGAGKAAGPLLLVALVLAVIGPILARVLYFTISRKREYLADATSARLTRYPEGLASALEKIGQSPLRVSTASSASAPFYIANPYRQHISGGAFATHPPLGERIRVLRSMSHGAGYVDYLKAYVQVTGRRRSLVPASDLAGKGAKADIRPASREAGPAQASAADSARRAGDIIRAMNGFAFITCGCGLRIKVPPEYPRDRIACPRCGRGHAVSKPDGGAVGEVLAASSAMGACSPAGAGGSNPEAGRPRAPQAVRFTPGKWQKVTCACCGHTYELSPVFGGRRLTCSGCGSTILVTPTGEAGDASPVVPA
jgi:heat shock protein HtpX